MHIGVIKFKVMLPNSGSLKAKRKIVKSLSDKLRHHFNVAVAEVEDNDLWQIATLGICFVSNSTHTLNRISSEILSYISANAFEYIVVEHKQDILTGF